MEPHRYHKVSGGVMGQLPDTVIESEGSPAAIVSRRRGSYTTPMDTGFIVNAPRSALPRPMRVALGIGPRILFFLLRYTLGAWLRWRFKITITYDDRFAALTPPFVVLANHVNIWDPFLVGLSFSPPVHFIAADGNFRGHLMRPLMALGGTIPKVKAKNDLESIRMLQRFIKERKIVGIFPEGQRSWDGTNRAVLPGTPKLVRLLRAPIVSVRLRGAYLAAPRWSKLLRRGPVELNVRTLLTRDEVLSLGKDEVTARIDHAVDHDESAWQRLTNNIYSSPRRAEHAEMALFLCPDCGGWGVLRSKGARLACTACGSVTWFAPSGRLYRERSGEFCRHRFDTVAAWNAYQLRRLTDDIDAPAPRSLRYVVPSVVFLTGYRNRVLYPRGDVSLQLDRETLTLTPSCALPSEGPATPVSIPIDRISGVHVQYAEQLEFYVGNTLYVLRMRTPWDSAYRIEETIVAIQRRAK